MAAVTVREIREVLFDQFVDGMNQADEVTAEVRKTTGGLLVTTVDGNQIEISVKRVGRLPNAKLFKLARKNGVWVPGMDDEEEL